MNIHANRTRENKNHAVINKTSQKQNSSQSGEPAFQFVDNRPETTTQMKLQKMTLNSPLANQALQLKSMLTSQLKIPVQKQGIEEEELIQGKFITLQKQSLEEEELLQGKFNPAQKKGLEEEELLQGKFEPVQKQENDTGLPDNLKSGIENLSGYSMDDVQVHFNSDKPAGLQAHAYAQGTDIHLAPGQEKHLPHEAWHVIQQKQGRVKPTMQLQDKVNVNDDAGLEKEADVMGAKAISTLTQFKDIPVQRQAPDSAVIQKFDAGIGAGWHIHHREHIKYANNNATRVNFGGRNRKQIGYELEQKIQDNGLAATKANADFIACRTWIRNNIA